VAADCGDHPAGEISVEIKEMFLKVIEAGALGHVIGKLVQVAEAEIAVLPISESDGLHVATIRNA
jgi:hypothetical protein